jgi:O-methyltransferase involved in polyketide biosynthesis
MNFPFEKSMYTEKRNAKYQMGSMYKKTSDKMVYMRIIEQNVMSTMVAPLWARAYYGAKNPDILVDKSAEKIFEQVKALYPDNEYEFSLLYKFVDEMAGLSFIIRARTYDDLIKKYIKNHPSAIIVNLGCGLDPSFSRVDNGLIKWYDLDLPEAIEFRKQLISEDTRNRFIPKSIFDASWYEDIEYTPEKGILFFAAGLINYFTEEQVTSFFQSISARFSDSQFIFDNPSTFGNKIVNKRMKKLGVTGSDFQFAVDDPIEKFAKISQNIHVIDSFSFYSRIPWNSRWKLRTKIQVRFANKMELFKFIHLKFIK